MTSIFVLLAVIVGGLAGLIVGTVIGFMAAHILSGHHITIPQVDHPRMKLRPVPDSEDSAGPNFYDQEGEVS